MYLPLLAPVTLLVLGAYAGLQYLRVKLAGNSANAEAFQRITNSIFMALIAGSVLVLGLTTYKRNELFSSEIVMWTDNVKKTPDNPRAHNNLGIALNKDNQLAAAIDEFKKAVALYPNYSSAHFNLGVVLGKSNQLDGAI